MSLTPDTMNPMDGSLAPDLVVSEEGLEVAIGMLDGNPPEGYDTWETWVHAEADALMAAYTEGNTPEWIAREPKLLTIFEKGDITGSRMIAASSMLAKQFNEKSLQARIASAAPTYSALNDEDLLGEWAVTIAEEALGLLQEHFGLTGDPAATAQYVIDIRSLMAEMENISLADAEARITPPFVVELLVNDIRSDIRSAEPVCISEPERHPGGWLNGYNFDFADVNNLIDRYLHKIAHEDTGNAPTIDQTAFATSRELLDNLAGQWGTTPLSVLVILDYTPTSVLCPTHIFMQEPDWYRLDESDRNPVFLIETWEQDGVTTSVFGQPEEGSAWDRLLVLLALLGGRLSLHDPADPNVEYGRWVIENQRITG